LTPDVHIVLMDSFIEAAVQAGGPQWALSNETD
jgi:hypothetical protein